jgi:peptide/nickel transport system permease protein
VLTFILLRVGPGDPALQQQGLNATPANIAAIRHDMGLDKPLVAQYGLWIGHVLKADPGRSQITYTSVVKEFRSRFQVTAELLFWTLLFTVVIGIPLGVISATKRNSVTDFVLRFFAVLGLAVPNFWLATLVILVPAQVWGYSPPFQAGSSITTSLPDNLRLFVPAGAVLSLSSIATVLRLTRSSLLETMSTDYIRTARAKGLRERSVVLRHGLRNAILPVLTIIGLLAAGLLGGAVIIESIFNLRGMGQYIYQSLLSRDYNVAQTLVLYAAAAVVFMNLAVDLMYSVVDPRVGAGGSLHG